MRRTPPVLQGGHPGAGILPPDLKSGTWARTTCLEGVRTSADAIGVQRVVVVVATALAAAVGWGTAGAVLVELVVTTVVAIVVECVVEDTLKVAVVEDDVLVTDLKLPKGLIMLPSWSILAVLRLK